MKNQKEILNDLEKELSNVDSLEKLKILKSKYIFKSEYLNYLREEIKKVDKSQISLIGKKINVYLQEANNLFENKKNDLQINLNLGKEENSLLRKEINEINLPKKNGAIHPLTILTFKVQAYFDSLKFSYSHFNEVEKEKYNFTILNMPASHPARKMQDTLYLKTKKTLLRTHATNMTARSLYENRKFPILGYSIGPVFRNDDNDSTHSFQFNQIDIFAVDNYSIANLKGVIDGMLSFVFDKKIDTRYRVSFFPFTEPSYEVDIKCPHCVGKGCNVCSNNGWIEILGTGMLHPNVFKNTGKNIEKHFGIAAGIGLERVAMIKWNLTDIRDFFNNDLNFLMRFKK